MTLHYLIEICQLSFRVEACTISDAAHLGVLSKIKDPAVQAFLAGEATMRTSPIPGYSEYPAMTVAQWRESFKRNGKRCEWPGKGGS